MQKLKLFAGRSLEEVANLHYRTPDDVSVIFCDCVIINSKDSVNIYSMKQNLTKLYISVFLLENISSRHSVL